MNPINTNLNNLFNIQNIIAIPEYQRNYSWSIEQWHFLVRDVLTAVTATKPRHWLGIILIDKPISTVVWTNLQLKVYYVHNTTGVDGSYNYARQVMSEVRKLI